MDNHHENHEVTKAHILFFILSHLILFTLGILCGGMIVYTMMIGKYKTQDLSLLDKQKVLLQIDEKISKSNEDCKDGLKQYWFKNKKDLLRSFDIKVED